MYLQKDKSELIDGYAKNKRISSLFVSQFGMCCLLSILLIASAPSAIALELSDRMEMISGAIAQITPMNLPNTLLRQWIHSHEEDQGDIWVYRTKGYAFPPARGREGMEFRENGEFFRYQVGPTDRIVTVSGQWRMKDTNVIEIQLSNQPASILMTILECNEQILRIRQTQ